VLLENRSSGLLPTSRRNWLAEGIRVEKLYRQSIAFAVSLGLISKVLSSLEEQLWVRRQGSAVLVPEPRRLLLAWRKNTRNVTAGVYEALRSPNPFGGGVSRISEQLQEQVSGAYAFTAAAAASVVAPFVELDRVDIFLGSAESGARLRQLVERESTGPKLRLITPYDMGVFLYSKREGKVQSSPTCKPISISMRGAGATLSRPIICEQYDEPCWRAA